MRQLILRGQPNPRQHEFFMSCTPHTAYGGARGGGKSWAMRRKFVLLACRYPKLQLLLLRRTLPELTENHARPLMAELYGFADYKQTAREFSFPNGSRIKLGYCDREADVYQYQGQEYDVVGLEEATHFTEAQTQFITTCNRSVRRDFLPRMYYTCNPGGTGHAWVKRLFIDRCYRDGERAADYAFIPAKLSDNPVLTAGNPDYIRKLQALPEPLRRAHLLGDWDALSGQYFSEFLRGRHACTPFAVPAHWKRFRAMDWGYNDPCCVLWFALAPDGRICVYRELYVRQTLSAEVARQCISLSRGENIAYTVAGPDAWQRRGDTGRSIAEVFIRGGMPLLPADNARVTGWQRVRELLADMPDQKPGLVIFDTCQNLLRTLPLLCFDSRDCEDVADGAEDHAADALRYGLMSRPAPVRHPPPVKSPAYDPFSPALPARRGFISL